MRPAGQTSQDRAEAAAINAIAAGLNVTSGAINAALRSGNATDVERIASAGRNYAVQLTTQMAQTTDAQERLQLQQRLEATNALLAQAQGGSNNTLLYLGGGALALAALWILTRRR